MKKQKKTPQPKFNLAVAIDFWRNQKITACLDKGGSFNFELYQRYLKFLKQ
jgi:hypothetical protein